jgi:iron(III) transport system substrate-binding protein
MAFELAVCHAPGVSEQNQRLQEDTWTSENVPRNSLVSRFFWIVWFLVAAAIAVTLFVLISRTPSRTSTSVVVYCAQDQVFAEPIFHDFEKESGIRVLGVFDSEAVKTVGIANKLLAERLHPRCDVFWGNEEMRARLLAAQKVFRETNGWSAFGYRTRRIVINTNHVSFASMPHSLLELTNEMWRGKVAFANPQFGTTSTHFHALRQYWGPELWESWCRGLAGNKPFLVDGNSVVVKLVGRGEAWIGLTDSDDIAAGEAEGMPITALLINSETLLIPNTVGIIHGAPHAEAAQKLSDYLQQHQVVGRLMAAGALEGFSAATVSTPTLKVDWPGLLKEMDQTTAKLDEIFLR